MFRVYILIFGALMIGGTIAAGYKVWTDTQEEITLLAVKNQTLENAVSLQDETIDQLQRDNTLKDQELQNTYVSLNQARRNVDLLEEKLSKNDIGMLAQKKPELVQRIINNASEKALRCFEILSGSELTDQERDANDGTEFNSECPWLFNAIRFP